MSGLFPEMRGVVRGALPGLLAFWTGLVPAWTPGDAHAAKNYPGHVTEMVTEARRKIRSVDIESFKQSFDRKDFDLLIDVREPREYRAAHIPGAINIPRGVIEFVIWRYVGFPGAINYDVRAYLYCRTGTRCALATRSLQELGFTNLRSVYLDLAQWLERGYPLEFAGNGAAP